METAIAKTVVKAVPGITNLISVVNHFESAWAKCFRIKARHDDGTVEEYFLKVSEGNAGFEALKGEFESTTLIHSLAPGFCPKPISQGTLVGGSTSHYYMCNFYELFEGVPEPISFCQKVAQLHMNHRSPEGKFGFHITTYCGNVPQKNTWCESWEKFFAEGLRHILDVREGRAGPCAKLDALLPDLFEKVIPRLLRPLETGGRKVIPSLVHGDLWCGNAAIVDDETEEGIIYDPASFWAHNEYELGNWRLERNKLTDYIGEYLTHYPKSEPADDFDDRNLLYSLRFNCLATALFPNENEYIDLALETIQELVAKFPNGYEE